MSTIMRRMNQITRCYGNYRADQLQDTELTSCHHSFILAICAHPGMSQDQLAKHTCLNKSTVTRTLAYLQEKGYVNRQTSSTDKRITLVYPTQKMYDILPRIRQIAMDWNTFLSEELSAEEITLFSDILDRLTQRAATYTLSKEEGSLS